MRHSIALAMGIVCLSALTSTARGQNPADKTRTWKATSGKYQIKAMLKEVKVILRDEKLKDHAVSLNTLSAADREFVGELLCGSKYQELRRELSAANERIASLETQIADQAFGAEERITRSPRKSRVDKNRDVKNPLGARTVANRFRFQNMSFDDDRLIGEALNESPSDIDTTFFRYSVYDASGRLTDTGLFYIDEWPSGGVKRFETYVNKPLPNDYTFTIDVDGK